MIIQSISGALRRRHVMNQDIGPGQQIIQQFAVLGLRQIQHHARLVRVEVLKQRTLFGILHLPGKGTAAAGLVAFGRLDLDNIGAEQRHQPGGKRRRDSLAAFNYGNSGQGQWRRAPRLSTIA